MPELLNFVLCEKAIIAQDHTISLITLFQGITVAPEFEIPDAPPGTPLALQLSWTAYTAWRKQESDENKSFEQRLSVQMPNNGKLVLGLLEFVINARVHTTLVPVLAWPIVGVGEYEVILEVREKSKGARFKRVASSPVNVHLGNLSPE